MRTRWEVQWAVTIRNSMADGQAQSFSSPALAPRSCRALYVKILRYKSNVVYHSSYPGTPMNPDYPPVMLDGAEDWWGHEPPWGICWLHPVHDHTGGTVWRFGYDACTVAMPLRRIPSTEKLTGYCLSASFYIHFWCSGCQLARLPRLIEATGDWYNQRPTGRVTRTYEAAKIPHAPRQPSPKSQAK